jgi:pimeloyl-ACP methyl ester carboxylesterase
MQTPEILTLDSGRKIALYRLAEGNGKRTVVFCHAAPGAGNLDPNPEETVKRKITLISVDRPGYGESEPVSGDAWGSVAAAADDLAEVLQKMNVAPPVGVVGWSAGGRVALALAARRPELVDRVVIAATPAPDEAVPWIPEEQKQGLEALRPLPPSEVHRQLAAQFAPMLANPSDEGLLSLLGKSSADDAVLAMPYVSDRLNSMLEAAFAQGAIGMAADIAGYGLRPWGFEPAEVQAKTLCLYGSKDPVAGSRHGTWWQKNLPQARLEMVPGSGHLLIFPMWHRVLSFLAPQRKGAR